MMVTPWSPNFCWACEQERKTGQPVSRHDLPKPKTGQSVQVNISPSEPEIRFIPVPIEPRMRA